MKSIIYTAVLSCGLLLGGCVGTQFVVDQTHTAQGQSERIEYIVLHYTAENDENSLAVLTTGQVSSHYLIPTGHDRRIYQLVDDHKKAWHAGASHFQGKTALNDISIGIEIVNAGVHAAYRGQRGYLPHEAYVDYEPQQIAKVAELLTILIARYDIPATNILAHSDIAPSRKIDPGAKFPWAYLYHTHGIGAWYDEQDKSSYLAQLNDEVMADMPISQIKAELRRYGYQINDSEEWDRSSQDVVYAFQLHFRPQRPTGVMDAETLAILRALNHKYRSAPQM